MFLSVLFIEFTRFGFYQSIKLIDTIWTNAIIRVIDFVGRIDYVHRLYSYIPGYLFIVFIDELIIRFINPRMLMILA